MQQSRISAFFKPSGDRRLKDKGEAESKARRDSSRILKKKRSYAQYHLELGQSDFLLRSCSVCGMMYACGDESDEKLHRDFHKKYYEGIQFKGLRDERVVSASSGDNCRILLVVDGDPPSHRRKVKEVLTIMEKELGFSDGQLLNKQCKVYLFISSYRVVGCLVAESIRMGHRVIENSASRKHTDHNNTYSDKMCQNLERKGPILQFGGISFKRVVIKRSDGKNKASIDECETGAVLCEEESVPALCGFRGIWVVPSQRRKQIASRLLDAARQSFSPSRILEHSQCAFSPPTSSGRALASRYCSGSAYLIYREEDV
ncbi:protein CHROMOSOME TRANSMISSION FIDELITY 7-like [Zingiber officinale]|uniref:protein CHROMOSOME TRANSMISSION FIDELITY 7-like n=1 Tax=Zingiber officinale TaxID=94328 RepID=UPI001C4C056E|nr:protein CHROMOSOME TRANSMISSION FIDELITY 7-like [Zingiber officinale]